MFQVFCARTTAARCRAPVVLVLMYHHIREPLPSDGPAARSSSADSFGRSLDYLAPGTRRSIRTRLADAGCASGARPPEKPVLDHLDDGWQEHATIVLPMLQRAGMVGGFFIHIGLPGEERLRVVRTGSASWKSQVWMWRVAIDPGIIPAVCGRQAPCCEHELRESRRVLELKLWPVLWWRIPSRLHRT